MRIRLLAAGLGLLTLPSCFQFEVAAQAGYANFAVDGNIGYVNGTSGPAVDQDIESAFGLGDDQGTPVVRAEVDTGVPVITVSAFMFEDSGRGRLNADFGDISAGLPVQTDFELTSIKGAYTFDIPIVPGIASIQPGIAVNYFDLFIDARDTLGISQQTVDLTGPIPLAYLRGEVELGMFSLTAEAGYLEVDVDDVSGSLLDAEAQLAINPTPLLELFVGYRLLEFQVDGQIDGDTVDTDFTLSGLMIGGGVRF